MPEISQALMILDLQEGRKLFKIPHSHPTLGSNILQKSRLYYPKTRKSYQQYQYAYIYIYIYIQYIYIYIILKHGKISTPPKQEIQKYKKAQKTNKTF